MNKNKDFSSVRSGGPSARTGILLALLAASATGGCDFLQQQQLEQERIARNEEFLNQVRSLSEDGSSDDHVVDSHPDPQTPDPQNPDPQNPDPQNPQYPL